MSVSFCKKNLGVKEKEVWDQTIGSVGTNLLQKAHSAHLTSIWDNLVRSLVVKRCFSSLF